MSKKLSVYHPFIYKLFSVILAISLGFASPVPASAAAKKLGSSDFSGGYYYLVPLCAQNRALTIKNGSMNNLANAFIYTRQNKARQVFYIDSIGDGVFRIINYKSGKALEVKSKRNGTNVRQNKNTQADHQKWYIIKRDGGYVIQSLVKSNRVLTVKNSQNKNKANVISSKYKKQKGQIWKLIHCSNPEATTSSEKAPSKPKKTTVKQTTTTEKPVSLTSTSIISTVTTVTKKVTTTVYQSVEKVASLTNSDFSAASTSSSTGSVGKRTLKAYLKNAMIPVGRTLYIWGGGWSDNDASVIGYQAKWNNFFKSHATASYDYKEYRYLYGNGLDCSGFAGWTLYNTLYSKSGLGWLVYQSSTVASNYAAKGWATLSRNGANQTFKPGDVVSMSGHVWISLGECTDESVLLVHSSPGGVQISGTPGKAATLARYYMKKYFKQWPFEPRTVSSSYLKYLGKATWKTTGAGSILKDPDHIQNMSAEKVMTILLGS